LRIFILGGTGSIGASVVRELVAAGHDVIGLARSEGSAGRLAELGATPLAGDIRQPESWTQNIPSVEAVVHAASDFSDDMEAVDRRLLDALLPALGAMPRRPRFLYTGGCWLYGATGDSIATETSPFDPLPAFAWSVPMIERVLKAPGVEPLIVHPAMVYTIDGGVISAFVEAARAGCAMRIVEGEHVRWPLIHADDLALLYRLVLERGATGSVYNGVAQDGVPVGAIADAVARRFGATTSPQIISADTIAAQLGDWARGYGMDQQMSGAKARRELGWRPVHEDMPAGLAEAF
jgi:nucleoside-diphosphate-sugar epimerase